jgi:hypothetical protein
VTFVMTRIRNLLLNEALAYNNAFLTNANRAASTARTIERLAAEDQATA